jgi:galactose-1-phosphate uridylyltransferase
MKFEAIRKEAVILNPAKDMEPRAVPIEVRRDPLTGRSARICHFRLLRWEKPDIGKIVAGTEAFCPFCPEKVMSATPCFPAEIVPEGRLVAGDRVLFPNIAPYDALGAVATLGSRHYIPMAEIEAERIAGGIRLALEFFRRVHAAGHPESVYHLVSWNYMPASGSSLIHPHLQVFATSTAPNALSRELEAAAAYFRKSGRVYWDELVAAEKAEGKRYLGRTGGVDWLSAYAPLGVAGDVLGVVAGCGRTLDLDDSAVADIALGLTRAMAAYDAMGLYNFNVCLFPGAAGDAHARLHVLFSARTYFNPALGTPDAAALRTLYNDSVCMAFPEEIAEIVRPHFAQRPSNSS